MLSERIYMAMSNSTSPRAIVGGCGVIELLRFVVDAATRKFIKEVLVERSS